MVPNGWEHLAIDQILTIGSGKDYKHLSSGNIPVYGSGGHMLNVSEYLYDGDSVCIGRKGTIDKPMFLSGKFWTVDTLFFTHSFKKTIPQYVYQYFLTINWRKYSEASGVPSLSKAIIQNIKLNLPPLPEQRKIANILGTWDKAISTTERLIDNSKQQKKALMQQLLTGKKRLLDDSGKPFEGEWEEVSLEEHIESFTNGYAFTASNYKTNGIPIVTMGNIGLDGSFNARISKRNYWENDKSLDKYLIAKGDLLIAMTDVTPDKNLIGRMTIVNVDEVFYLNQRVGLIRLKSSIDTAFLKYLSNDLKWRKYSIAVSASGVQANMSTKDIKKGKLQLPSIEEQQKIAVVLTNADEEIELLEQQFADLKQEKKALMQQLLTGKRRVKVDNTEAA